MHFDLIMCYNIVHGLSAIRFDDMFTFNNSCTHSCSFHFISLISFFNNSCTFNNSCGHSLEIHVPVAKFDIRRYSFAVRVVPIWNSLPKKIVTASTTKAFKHSILSHNFNVFLKFRYM